jgi:hypothetical protein
VASVKTRVELQRNFMRDEWQDAKEFLDGELKDRTRKFSEDGAFKFLDGLRNYSTCCTTVFLSPSVP